MPLRSRLLALALVAAPAAAPGQAVLEGEGIAGIGVQGCETVSGTENVPVLAAAVDWGLGYLAGRRDAGHRPVPGEPLSTTDPADLAVGIVLYCRANPYGMVLDALRNYGLRVFGEGPPGDPAPGPAFGPALRPALPRVAPPPRPADGAPAELVARLDAAREEDRLAFQETAAAAAAAGLRSGPAGFAARMAAGPRAPVSVAVSRRAPGTEAPSVLPAAQPPVGRAPASSPRPPRRAAAAPIVRPSGPL